MMFYAYELLCDQLQHNSFEGMTKEATLMLDYMKIGGDPDMEVKFCTCLDVRSRTLAILPILQRSYAHHTAVDHDRDVVFETEKSRRYDLNKKYSLPPIQN